MELLRLTFPFYTNSVSMCRQNQVIPSRFRYARRARSIIVHCEFVYVASASVQRLLYGKYVLSALILIRHFVHALLYHKDAHTALFALV